MPEIRKINAINLENYQVFVQDTNPTSRYFNITELPNTFTGGKNAFLIAGSDLLVSDTEIKIEIKDSNGDTIFWTPGLTATSYYEGISKVISVWVYETTATGPCTITIMGELKEYYNAAGNKVPIPNEWKGRYNVRWQSNRVNVKPFDPNVTKVRFSRSPKIQIQETLLNKTKYLETKKSWPQYPTHWNPVYVEVDEGFTYFSNNYSIVPTLNFRKKLVSQFPTNEQPTSVITISNPWMYIAPGTAHYPGEYASASFNSSMIGSTISYEITPDIYNQMANYNTTSLPGLNLSGYGYLGDYYNKFAYYELNTSEWEGFPPQAYLWQGLGALGYTPKWKGTVLEIYSTSSALISGVPNTFVPVSLTVPSNRSLSGTYQPFSFPVGGQMGTGTGGTYISSSLQRTPESQSLATITLRDIDTFTGDATRLKLYYSSRSDSQNYKLLQDIQIESNELLQTSSYANRTNVRTGLFTGQEIIDTFWSSTNLYTYVTPTWEGSIAFDSVKLSPLTSVQDKKSTNSALYKFYNKEPVSFSVNSYYQLDFNATLSGSQYNYGKLEVYMSGSVFISSSTNPYGKLIGYIETDKNYKIFDKQQYTFKPDKAPSGSLAANGYVVFVGKNGGNFYLHDISLRAIAESGFTPNDVTLRTLIPLTHNSESLDIKCELYDTNNNLIPVNVNKTFTFGGGNSIGQPTTVNILNQSTNGSVLTTGTNPISTDNIQLAGTAGTSYLSLGQTAGAGYNTTGIFLGNTSTNVNQLSLVSGNDYLLWDGTYLYLETKSLIATDISNVIFKNGLFVSGSATRSALSISGSTAAVLTGSFSMTGSFNLTGSMSVSAPSRFDSDLSTAGVLYLLPSDSNRIEIGGGATRTASGHAYIDFIGDTTYTDYGLRIIRSSTGANAGSSIFHRGTGDFSIQTTEAAAILLRTSNTERVRIKSSGEVGIGVNPSWKLDVNGTTATTGTVKNIVTKSSAYTATTTDDTILCNTSGGSITISLPKASSATGLVLTIKKINTANSVTIDPDLSELIDGAATYTVGGAGTRNSATVQCDGSAWYVLSYFSG